MTTAPIITILSDYGLRDDFVGVCHGVIAGVCPDARVIDVTHGVPRGDIRAGALVLRGALPYLPVGVHIAVVDPGVGGDRRAAAVRLTDGRVLVGPDNGLLSLCFAVGGGVVEAVDIGRSRFAFQPVSATFHGRDIFAPVAARVACGAALADAGEPIDPAGLLALSLPRARLEDDALVAHAIYVDAFGNVQLDAEPALAGRLGLALGRELLIGNTPARYARTFGDAGPGELVLYEDSDRRLALAVNRGSAADRLGVVADDELRIRLS
ncbi:MAG: SAM-dependent chlorinase/fluorinase [Solirubrobacterales bacterium]|nr:SAM-dependent chlorinase/fluorinase [Solirubrobacterales bacterium]